MSRPRRNRKWLIVGAGVVIVLVVLVLLLPAIMSRGPGQHLIARAVEAQLRGTAHVEELHLTWRGPQSIRGLEIVDASGRKAADLNITIDAALLPIVLGSAQTMHAQVGGTLTGELREDGTNSFRDLVRESETKPAVRRARATRAREPVSLAGVPATTIDLTGIDVVLDLRGREQQETFFIDGLAGALTYGPGEDAHLRLDGRTRAGAMHGAIQVVATGADLFDTRGEITPKGAAIDGAVRIVSIPVPFAGPVDEIRVLDVVAKASDLSARMDVTIRVDTVLAGNEPSILRGTFTVAEPVRPDGRIDVGLVSIDGELTGERVPTALLQPVLAGTPILLSRDVGRTFEVAARIAPDRSARQLAGAAQPRGKEVSVRLTASQAELSLGAAIAPDGAVDGKRFEMSARIEPALVSALHEAASIDAPAALTVRLDSFGIPARREDGTLPLGEVALDGSAWIARPVRLTVARETPVAIRLGDLRLAVASDRVGEGVHLTGSVMVDEGTIEFDERVTGLVDGDGRLDLAAALPAGRLEVRGLDGSRIAALLPDTAAIVEPLLAGAIDGVLRTEREDGGLRGALSLETDVVKAVGSLRRRPDGLDVSEASLDLTLTPALVAAVQPDAEYPVGLAAPAAARLILAPTSFTGSALGDLRRPDAPLRVDVTVDAARLTHHRLREALAVRGLAATVTLHADETRRVAIQGNAVLARDGDDAPFAAADGDLTATRGGEETNVSGRVHLTRLSLASVESLLGLDRGTVTDWLGAGGDVRLDLADDGDASTITIASEVDRLRGTLVTSVEDDVLEVTGEDLALTVGRGTLTRALARASSGMDVARDVPLELDVTRLRLPTALLRGAPFDPAEAGLDVRLRGGPIRLVGAGGIGSLIEDVDLRVSADDLAGAIDLAMTGRTVADGGGEPGTIAVTGSLTSPVTDDSVFSLARGALTLDATVEHVPTIIADVLLGMDGLLADAAGPRMSAHVTSRGFSTRGGRLSGRIDATNGFIEGAVEGADEALRISADAPLRASLQFTPPLRQRLLRKVNPILADIRTIDEPVRFAVPGPALIPLDGDTSRMNGEVSVTVGDVVFDGGAAMLRLLALFNAGEATIPGSIEPIAATIRGGVVTYERFAVHVDKYTLLYRGRVDLNTKQVVLRTEVPLEAMAMTFRELEGYVDKINVPIVTRGTFGRLETEIDPSFDLAGAALDAGFRGVLNEVLEDEGIPLGDILGDLFGGGRKKKPEPKSEEAVGAGDGERRPGD